MGSVEPPQGPPQKPPEDTTQKTPPEPFPKIDGSRLNNFEKNLMKTYHFSEKQAKQFIEQMEQFVVYEMKRGFERMGKSIKKMFKDED
jgi:hypothetical protein